MRFLRIALPVPGCLMMDGASVRSEAAPASAAAAIARPEPAPRAVWTQWRGAGRDGAAAPSDRAWPEALDGLTPSWRLELGKGYSGPIVGPRYVFVVETRDTPEGERAGVRALDRDTGAEIWSREWPSAGAVPSFAAANGDWVRSTPALDGSRLYLGNGRLECVDLASGASRWKTEPLGRYWSMVHRGDRILALNETGTLFLIRADPSRFQLLDRRDVSDQETWAHLAVAGDGLFVRSLEEIRAWSWTPKAAGGPIR